MSPDGTLHDMLRETILRLEPGEDGPEGYEILRILGSYEQPIGTGTNTKLVYVVAARRRADAPER